MKIIQLIKSQNTEQSKELIKQYALFERLIQEMNKKELPSNIVSSVNHAIEQTNSFIGTNKELLKHLIKTQSEILEFIEQELKIVPKNRYASFGLLIGMGVFAGFSGPVFGMGLEIGIPLGMLIGLAIGLILDKKAKEKGKQMNLEI